MPGFPATPQPVPPIPLLSSLKPAPAGFFTAIAYRSVFRMSEIARFTSGSLPFMVFHTSA